VRRETLLASEQLSTTSFGALLLAITVNYSVWPKLAHGDVTQKQSHLHRANYLIFTRRTAQRHHRYDDLFVFHLSLNGTTCSEK